MRQKKDLTGVRMKKIFATLVGLVLATGISFAEDSAKNDSRFGAGVKAAFDYSMMYGFEEDIDGTDGNPSGFGFDAGLMFRLNLAKGLYFAPEVNFAYTSTNHKFLKKERSYTSMDLEIPLMFRASFAFLEKLYITAGPQIVLNLSNESDIPPMADGSTLLGGMANGAMSALGYTEHTEQGFFNFGIAAGLGYNIVGGLNIDARFYMGFMELFPDTKAIGYDDVEPGDAFTYINMHGAKMMKFKVGVSYWFM